MDDLDDYVDEYSAPDPSMKISPGAVAGGRGRSSPSHPGVHSCAPMVDCNGVILIASQLDALNPGVTLGRCTLSARRKKNIDIRR